MNSSKFIRIFLVAVCLFAFCGSLSAAQKFAGATKKETKSAKVQKDKKGGKKGKRSVRILRSTDSTAVEEICPELPSEENKAKKDNVKASKSISKKGSSKAAKKIKVTDSVFEALASGDIKASILTIREQRVNPKLMYLMRQVDRINNHETGDKPKKDEAHKDYQNLGIAYHNLYLFLKAKGVDQEKYYKEALDFYKKARSAGNRKHKADCDMLSAAIIAASGDTEKAAELFKKISKSSMRGDFESQEYIAAYYAAVGNVTEAIEALEVAYKINSGALITWLALGDDFWPIKDAPEYKNLLVTWKAAEVGKRLAESVPMQVEKEAKPASQEDETSQFRPQKAIPHYDLKKDKKNKKKSVAKKTKRKSQKENPKSQTKR